MTPAVIRDDDMPPGTVIMIIPPPMWCCIECKRVIGGSLAQTHTLMCQQGQWQFQKAMNFLGISFEREL